jgi:hypothetical protein
MNYNKSLRNRIGESLERAGARSGPSFVTDPRYQEEPEFAEAIPSSRWHSIDLDWRGRPHRFQMNIYKNFHTDIPTIRLGHVYEVDMASDDWVELPKEVLEEARNDGTLMAKLVGDVEALERGRMESDDQSGKIMEESGEGSEEEVGGGR